MNIREIATSRLREYENNPRNNDLAVEKVKYSIQRFGFLVPVIVDINYTIVAGHTRVRACRELGIQSVPCIVADELTEEQVNFFRLVDNKTSEYSDWDFEKLKEELSLIDLTLDENQLLLEQFELSAEVFDLDAEQAEIKIPAFNFMGVNDKPKKPPVSTMLATSLRLHPPPRSLRPLRSPPPIRFLRGMTCRLKLLPLRPRLIMPRPLRRVQTSRFPSPTCLSPVSPKNRRPSCRSVSSGSATWPSSFRRSSLTGSTRSTASTLIPGPSWKAASPTTC